MLITNALLASQHEYSSTFRAVSLLSNVTSELRGLSRSETWYKHKERLWHNKTKNHSCMHLQHVVLQQNIHYNKYTFVSGTQAKYKIS